MVRYEIDKAHTHVGFTAKHLAVSTVRGQFNSFDGYFEGPEDDVTKIKGEVTIDVVSIDTRTEMRDNHLRSADFFEAEKYPKITFKLNRVEPVDSESFKFHGDLTIKSTTKPVVLNATLEGRVPDPMGGGKELLSLTRSPGGLMRYQALARVAGVSNIGASRRLEQMTKAGLIERRSSPTDRRGVFAHISAKGEAPYKTAHKVFLTSLERNFGTALKKADAELISAALPRLA